ncbi:TetR/AcrR family transcriptional regulator [Aeromonas enteropelogenes]|uniref:TetR/AcrR family transcriptional regulator n=1 Tax=Aeromonas enteropelogenes TaxID=29489 RepID=A0ABU9J7N1_AEREN|nr:TetR/AcrR family transcriptional regulator [Aeromonas enteropelogenes]MBL0458484.1 TetR/AcrR family transcriptional regulator [Aeromonas enteropelogenes]UAK71072.1 TetR/AcrR family transcriptional regulator [Aeromonas enteropelogenes]UBH26851.1 TetR/AcrR family transcriptional regulator [Aeromonas enteropelogenes]UBH56450.1 TetR/AcrR family transcriptional regulator [Aeromonas enteropelogenes]UCA09315.1 TetR/AcrR family transcriptional regulator [Aeromonas enteropelogenes]
MTDKRRQILDAALALCAEDGLQGAATARIAKAAGVANGTLFHHFPSKEALILQLYQDVKQRMGAAICEADPALSLREQTRHYWQLAMAWMLAHPNELKFVLGFFHSPMLARETRSKVLNDALRFLPALLAQGQASGELMQAPAPLMLEVCQGQFLACASLFVDQPELGQDAHWQASAFALFWSAISGANLDDTSNP